MKNQKKVAVKTVKAKWDVDDFVSKNLDEYIENRSDTYYFWRLYINKITGEADWEMYVSGQEWTKFSSQNWLMVLKMNPRYAYDESSDSGDEAGDEKRNAMAKDLKEAVEAALGEDKLHQECRR